MLSWSDNVTTDVYQIILNKAPANHSPQKITAQAPTFHTRQYVAPNHQRAKGIESHCDSFGTHQAQITLVNQKHFTAVNSPWLSLPHDYRSTLWFRTWAPITIRNHKPNLTHHHQYSFQPPTPILHCTPSSHSLSVRPTLSGRVTGRFYFSSVTPTNSF